MKFIIQISIRDLQLLLFIAFIMVAAVVTGRIDHKKKSGANIVQQDDSSTDPVLINNPPCDSGFVVFEN
jgi:hypothetical protein